MGTTAEVVTAIMKPTLLHIPLLTIVAIVFGWCDVDAFLVLPQNPEATILISRLAASSSTSSSSTREITVSPSKSIPKGNYAPRTGLSQSLLTWALTTPVWKYVLVPKARDTIIQTAEANGIEWRRAKDWIGDKLLLAATTTTNQHQPQEDDTVTAAIPHYYQEAPFHAYKDGNLCWEAAMEQEIASRAVGARNFPQFGEAGDSAFRQAMIRGLCQAGAKLPSYSDQHGNNNNMVVAVDLGCGTGLSSRQLATTEFPTNGSLNNKRTIDKVFGIDLSPYYIQVGTMLLNLAPLAKMTEMNPSSSTKTQEAWINPIDQEMKDKVHLQVGNAEDTGLDANSVDIVQILFVMHELPSEVAVRVLREAHRILKPGGQLWMGEMDFQSPPFAAQRANALLFSLLRATEPYLDDYADNFATHIQSILPQLFEKVVWTAATGRHYTMVATKGKEERKTMESRGDDKSHDRRDKAVVEDYRFLPNGDYAVPDTHLQLWESKSVSDGKSGNK
jgi:SAM-dependent methyltransferase